ncbi:MFS transporter [Pseudactinotalea sp. Z1732]|uniref:MFS transporter n=1 Tax=Micrococcales TaxID=85006 RepID=UPI003C7C1ED1
MNDAHQPSSDGAASPSQVHAQEPQAPTPEAPTSEHRLGANYWKLFSASALTNLGDGLMAIAVVWLASALTRDPLWITLVGLASRLPWLLFSLPAGVITDRYDRRYLVAAMDVARFVVVAVFAVVLLLHQEGLPTPAELAAGAPEPAQSTLLLIALILMALLLGFAEVLRDNTAQTLLPSIVDKRLLEKANGRMWGAETALNNFVGPPLAGFLVAIAIAIPFGANAVFLAISAVLIFSLKGSFRPRGATVQRSKRIAWRAEIGEGFGWLWRHPVLRALALLLGASNLAGAIATALFVLFAQDVLGLFDGWQFGLLLTGIATGAIAGSLVAERVAAVLTEGRSLLSAMMTFGLGYTAIGLLSSGLAVWAVSVLIGFAIVLWNVITVSLRQRIIPDHLLGRVNSVYRFFGWGTMSLGVLVSGLLVTWLEPGLGREWALRTPFLAAGALSALLLPYAWTRVNTSAIEAAKAVAEVGDDA